MMVNLNVLENLMQNQTDPLPRENLVDEHFDQIVNLIEQEKATHAAKLIEIVFDKGVADIRLIVYYFYAHFTENGIHSFGKTFPLFITLVTNYWDKLTPKNKIDKHLQSSLNWFFSHLLLRIKYYEKLHLSGKIHPVWKKSIFDVSIEELENLNEIVQEFNQFFLRTWPKSQTKERVLHLANKIEEIKNMLSESILKEEKIQQEEEEIQSVLDEIPIEKLPEASRISHEEDWAEEMDHSESADLNQTFESEEEQQNICDKTPFSCSDIEELKEFLPSFMSSLEDLSRKLKIFEMFINQNDYLKAAVVARDIDHLIENFDPLHYFPKLFSNYFSLFAKHVAALADQYEKKESPQIKALEKLYRTNLEMFVEWS